MLPKAPEDYVESLRKGMLMGIRPASLPGPTGMTGHWRGPVNPRTGWVRERVPEARTHRGGPECGNIDAALELAKQHPHLNMPGSEIEVHEAQHIPGM